MHLQNLRKACSSNDIESVDQLIAAKVDVNSQDQVQYVHVHMSFVTINSVSRIHTNSLILFFFIKNGDTGLILASYLEHTAIVKSLLEAKANVDTQNNVRCTCTCTVLYCALHK